MSDEARRALVRVLEAAAVVIAMRAALEAYDAMQWKARGIRANVERIRARIAERIELERTMRKERHGPTFEAWLATREAADDGAD